MGWFGDLLGQMIQGLSGTDKIAATFAAFGLAITDGKMWRSLGWLLLGVVLVAAGLILLIKGPVNARIAQAQSAVGAVAR